MIYNGIELSGYPICDTDIWVDLSLADLIECLFEKHGKIIIADVVEKEIMKFSRNPQFKIIEENYVKYKNAKDIIVIKHSDIDKEDRLFLEKQLKECDSRFQTGLRDSPHEKHKGEIVSAIYAEYFSIPFLKSNDGAFKKGNMGYIAFPNLLVKNRKNTLEELVPDTTDRAQCHKKIHDSRMFMNEGKRIYEEEKNSSPTQAQIDQLLLKLRGK